MNLPALKGGVSCKRCIVLRGSFCKEIINCGGLLPFFVGVTNSNRPEGRGIRPPRRIKKGQFKTARKLRIEVYLFQIVWFYSKGQTFRQ
jgi:hypothetical protein